MRGIDEREMEGVCELVSERKRGEGGVCKLVSERKRGEGERVECVN